MLIIDDAMEIIYASNEYREVAGFTEEELLGEKWYNVIHKDDKEIIIQYLKNRIDEGEKPFTQNIQLANKKGKEITVAIEVSSIPGTEMSVISIKELSHKPEIFKLYYDNAPEGLISFNDKGEATAVNNKMVSILDVGKKRIIGFHFTEILEMFGIELVEVTQNYKDILRDIPIEKTEEWTLSNIRYNDYVLEIQSVFLLEEDTVVGFTLHVKEVTKKRKEEEKLHEQKKKLRDIITLSSVIGWESHIKDERIDLSHEIFKKEILNPDLRPLSIEELENFEKNFKHILQKIGEQYILGDIGNEYYFRFINPQNKPEWYKVMMKREKDRCGRIVKIRGVIQNAHERNSYEDLKVILHTISQQADEKDDLNTFMIVVHDVVKEVLHIKNSYILIQNNERNYVKTPTSNEKKYKNVTDILEPEKSLIERVIKQERTLQEVEEKNNYLEDEGKENIEVKKSIWIGIPLKCGDEVIGVFVLHDYFNNDLYSKEKIELLEYVSCVITKAVRLHQYRQQIERVLKNNMIMHKEIHHRVNNNLQIIIGLLNLQCETVKTKNDAIKGFKESCDRVEAMGKIYELFYESENISEINIAEYVTSISNNLKMKYDKTNKVKIEYNIADVHLNLDQLDKLGLILNELVTNAIKCAFKEKDKGTIKIVIQKEKACYIIIVEDDGRGMPEKININNPKTLGLSLVHMLTKQLQGTLKLDRKNGTSFTLILPK